MSVLFKSVTAAFSCFLYLLISISRGATLVTFLFFVLFMLKTSNEKLISLVCICFSLTNYSLIPVWVYLESTSALTLRFFPFLVLIFARMFNSLSILLYQFFGIIYLDWEFTEKISCTIPTQDHFQNPVFLSLFLHLHHLIPLELFASSLTVFLYSLWWCVLPYHIWNTFWFPFLSSSSISLLYACICCS